MTNTEAQVTRILNWVALVIAAILLLVVLADIYKRNLFSENAVAASQYSFDDLPGKGGKVLSANMDGIISKHIFGEKPKAAPPPKAEPVVKKPPPPKAKLNVKISGIIEGGSPESGFAMLNTGKGSQVVGVGEELGTTGAILKAVYPDRVVFDRDGHEESVEMKRKTLDLNAPLPDAKVGGEAIDVSGRTTPAKRENTISTAPAWPRAPSATATSTPSEIPTRTRAPQTRSAGSPPPLPIPDVLKNL